MGSTQRSDDSNAVTRVREAVVDPVLDALEPVFDVLRPILGPIFDSVLLTIAAAGAVLVVLGAVLNEGVWAAIVGVWGFGLLLVGLSLYGFIWWRRN